MNQPTLTLTEIQIWPVRNPDASRVKAMASITINDALKINNLRIIEGSKGLFVSFPSEKKPGTDTYYPIALLINRQDSDIIQAQILERFAAVA